MRKVHVPLGGRSYDILIEKGCLRRLGAECARLALGSRCAVITDRHVGLRYAKTALAALKAGGIRSRSRNNSRGRDGEEFADRGGLLRHTENQFP